MTQCTLGRHTTQDHHKAADTGSKARDCRHQHGSLGVLLIIAQQRVVVLDRVAVAGMAVLPRLLLRGAAMGLGMGMVMGMVMVMVMVMVVVVVVVVATAAVVQVPCFFIDVLLLVVTNSRRLWAAITVVVVSDYSFNMMFMRVVFLRVLMPSDSRNFAREADGTQHEQQHPHSSHFACERVRNDTIQARSLHQLERKSKL